ncbi:unnamed protein product [Amoebophrya sp. A25]|nr:unnamed protein product [Amoebophrya sp. A25]|eukprot:GSA25T00026791001.1
MTSEQLETFRRELDAYSEMQRSPHANLVTYIGCMVPSNDHRDQLRIGLVIELVDGVSMYKLCTLRGDRSSGRRKRSESAIAFEWETSVLSRRATQFTRATG